MKSHPSNAVTISITVATISIISWKHWNIRQMCTLTNLSTFLTEKVSNQGRNLQGEQVCFLVKITKKTCHPASQNSKLSNQESYTRKII